MKDYVKLTLGSARAMRPCSLIAIEETENEKIWKKTHININRIMLFVNDNGRISVRLDDDKLFAVREEWGEVEKAMQIATE